MECLYCHKKFSSLRFWKSSQFCSPEHAEDYRTQTLDRLMGDDSAGSGEKQPLPLPEILGPEQEPALAGPPQLNAAPPESEWAPAQLEVPAAGPVGFGLARPSALITPPPAGAYPTIEEILSRAGKQDSGPAEEIASWQQAPGSPSDHVDVRQQTAEEALEALRSLARGQTSDDTKRAGGLEDAAAGSDWDDTVVEPGTARATQDAEADDVFAELRRIASTSDDASGEEPFESFDPAAPIPSFSALDHLLATPKPRPREAIPGLSIPAKGEQAAPFNAEAAAEISEAEIARALAEEVVEATFPEAGFPEAVSSEAGESGPAEEHRTKEGGDKVVSFPSQSDLRRKNSVAQTNASVAGGPSFFDPEIHDELVAVDLDGITREARDFAINANVALDDTLKAPAAAMSTATEAAKVVTALACQGFRSVGTEVVDLSPAIRSLMIDDQGPLGSRDARDEPIFHTVAMARLEFRRPGGFELCAVWRDNISAPVVNQKWGADATRPTAGEPKRAAVSFTPELPLGLLEKMGVTPAGWTGQFVRSELFHKEPEVREFPFPRNDADASRPADVRRVYYA